METVVLEPEFKAFPKIPRLFRPVIVTEKVDGTCGVVHVAEDLRVRAGSKNRWVTPQDDNFGFAAWVEKHEADLRRLGPGLHYGEWWGKGIQRGYGLDERRFSLFNVLRWSVDPMVVAFLAAKESAKKETDLPHARPPLPACCDVVPVLGVFDAFSTDDVGECLAYLRKEGSRAVPGWERPEGIVVFHAASGWLAKVTLENDVEPKGDRR